MPISFATQTGGSAADRTYTDSARNGRLYDDDSETLQVPPSMDENLLKISVRKADPDVHYRTFKVAPASGRTAVTLKIQYGASLAWPIGSTPSGWRCNRSAQTCTAANPAKPAPLYADFVVPKGGSAAARTYSVTATAGLVHDTDSETLAPIQLDELLLRITTPDPQHDPNPLFYNRFLDVRGGTGRVTLELSWGRNLTWMTRSHRGWTCSLSTARGTCWTDNYVKPLNTEWAACPSKGSTNQLTVRASRGGRYDIDSVQIPPAGHRPPGIRIPLWV
jgi:hypothetical protein